MNPGPKPRTPGWVGDALRLRRLERRWSCRDLAEQLKARGLKVGRSTLEGWEKDGGPTPPPSTVLALAELFGCEVEAFARKPRIT